MDVAADRRGPRVQWISGYFPIALTITAMIGYVIALERLMGMLDRPTVGGELLHRAGFAAAALGATADPLRQQRGLARPVRLTSYLS